MTNLPKQLKRWDKEAHALLDQKRVHVVEFSGLTYLFDVLGFYPFLSLGVGGGLRESFCTCEEGEGCLHIAAAWLKIFDAGAPIHKRYQRSIWPLLMKNLFLNKSKKKQESARSIRFIAKDGGVLFTYEGEREFIDFFKNRPPDTEENSIKFSHLGEDELIKWRAGAPSDDFAFELSRWGDFGKALFLRADKASPKVTFTESEEGIPNGVEFEFDSFRIGFPVSKEILPSVIPTLRYLETPLKVHRHLEGEAFQLEYHPKQKMMKVKGGHHEQKSHEKGIVIDGWVYVKGEGFIPVSPAPILAQGELKGEEINELLDHFLPEVKRCLPGISIHERPLKLHYSLIFNDQGTLTIEAFAFEIGDLSSPEAGLFQHWVYVPSKGFFPHEGAYFKTLLTKIPKEEVSHFVNQHRSFLNDHSGFETHQVSIEAEIGYEVNEEGSLSFQSQVLEEEGETIFDFGDWVYVPEEGFYQKMASELILPLNKGEEIHKPAVPFFIHRHQEELVLVTDFFAKKCPIEGSGLQIGLSDEGKITLDLSHQRLLEYEDRELIFYDDYVYCRGEGFSHLPIDPTIPEIYHSYREIDAGQQEAFLSLELPYLAKKALSIDARLVAPKILSLRLEKIFDKGGKKNYQLWYKSEKGRVSAYDLVVALQSKKRFALTEAGLIDLKETKFNWMRQLDKKKLGDSEKGLRLESLDLLKISAFDTIHPPKEEGRKGEKIRQELSDLLNLSAELHPTLEGFLADLRPYQEIGLAWLWFLYRQGLSGLLCDDMGLGKTLQAMALMVGVRQDSPKKSHFLVICPTSVIYHWQDKLKAFYPQAKVFTFYGAERDLSEFNENYDVLLTSYGIWRREHLRLSKIPFEIAVLDEIQLAKNHRSKLHTSLTKIKAKMRLGMTGTPIENYLRELKSLFDLVLPGYMPGPTEFRDFFSGPIEREGNLDRQQLLSRFVKPFILRRKKEDVLKELPDKVEEITYCPLLPDQMSLYNTTLVQSREAIVNEMEGGRSTPFLHVFTLLSRLKQICDHPAVYNQDVEGYRNYSSGKWERFIELIDEARDSRQKVVVFSQYLKQLDIIGRYLDEKGIGYAEIRGDTVKRAEQISRFQKDPNCEVFIASLGAAGLGIELTAASVVIHYDRWWNAARENQATDRVHRIGQTKGVQVFKMVTRGTFEEKIHEMILRKGRLMEDVIGVDEQELLKSLSPEEILELLQTVELRKEDQPLFVSDEDESK